MINELREVLRDKKVSIVELPDPYYSEQLSDEIISYDGENKKLYGNDINRKSIYGEDISSFIHKIEDVNKGKIS